MKTIMLEIGALDAGSYPLRLLEDGNVLAATTIPADYQQAGLTRDPHTFRGELLDTATEDVKFETFGTELWKLLDRDAVGQEWRRWRANHPQLRTLLSIVPPEWQLFPWELLCEPPRKKRLWLFGEQPLVRARAYQATGSTTLLPGPLRMLIVKGALDTDGKIGVEKEIERILQALRPVNRTIDVEILPDPLNQALSDSELAGKKREILNKETLDEKLKTFRPHIFHFIGHSEENSDQEMGLVFEGTDGRENTYWTAGEISNSDGLQKARPQFVFLNSCRSGQVLDPARQQEMLTLGEAFEAPAVLAMQADVDGEYAGQLAGVLYKSLAEGQPLDVALAQARDQVKNATSLKRREWALPVLTVALPPEQILHPTPLDPTLAGLIENCPQFRLVRAQFVNRTAERRQVVQSFYPIVPAAGPNSQEEHLLLIRGPAEIGKSWMVQWCLEACARLGHNVRYVEIVDSDTGKDWLDVLLQIRDGHPREQNSLIRSRLSADAFADFNWELHERLQGKADIEPRNGRLIDPPPQKNGQLGVGEQFAPKMLESFRLALAQAAQAQPLLLALDHFQRGPDRLEKAHWQQYLVEYLIQPLARGEIKNVKAILIMNEEEYKYFMVDHATLCKQVYLEKIESEKFEPLAREYFPPLLEGKFTPEGLTSFIQGWKNGVNNSWSPSLLNNILTVAKLLP